MKINIAQNAGQCFALTATLLLTACASSEPARPDRRPDASDRQKSRSSGPITTLSSAGLLLASFNRNGDYSIDQIEFIRGSKAAFEIADGNGDDSLDRFELDHWRINALGSADASPGVMFFDANFDNIVSHAEFDAALGKIYQSSDKDGDGIIRFSELIKVVSKQQSGGREPGARREGGSGDGKRRRGPR